MNWGLAQYGFTAVYYYVQKPGTAEGKERAVYRSFLELLVLLVQAKRTYRKIKNVENGALYCMHKEGAGFMQYSLLTFLCLWCKESKQRKIKANRCLRPFAKPAPLHIQAAILICMIKLPRSYFLSKRNFDRCYTITTNLSLDQHEWQTLIWIWTILSPRRTKGLNIMTGWFYFEIELG